MQDSETGERRRTLDRETGETLSPVHVRRTPRSGVSPPPPLDAETGELEVAASSTSGCRQRHFQVPRDLYGGGSRGRGRLHNKRAGGGALVQQQQQVCCIEERMVTGSQNMSPVVFMLPTLFMCPAWAAVLCCAVEVCIHVWAHKCNRVYNNGGVFYKSPLHMVTSEFCARCRSERVMQTVGKLQDERKLKVDNKKLRGYVESVSSLVTKI